MEKTYSLLGRSPWLSHTELLTWLVLSGNYAAWFFLTWNHTVIPWWLLLFLGGFTVCLHGSLQHELLHGHPTRSPRINKLLVWIPLGLWMPYTIYRDSHIGHHQCERLTDPIDDPESFYFDPAVWNHLPHIARYVLKWNNTLGGRLTIGPVLVVTRFWYKQTRQLVLGDWHYAKVWIWHFFGCALVLYWVMVVCGLSFWQYVLFFAWPGLSLTLLRSFTEHRPVKELDQRTIIVEGSWLTRLLFLNNNYHHVHHADPGLAWYLLRRRYDATRDKVNRENGGFYFKNYAAIFRNYLLKPKDAPVYPYA